MGEISIKKAAMINFVGRYFNIFIQLLINGILARLLSPEDYGVVAVITVFISFFTIISDMGIGPAIIQNKELNQDDIGSIFNITILIGIITALLFCIFSYGLAYIYDNTIYIGLGQLLAIGIFFNVINMVPKALILRAKRFKVIAIRTIVISIIAGTITIALALMGGKYYALIVNTIISALLLFIWNILTCGIKFNKKITKSSIDKIKSFSSYQFAFNIVNYFSRNIDNLLIGKFLSPVALGYYDKAYKLMLYPVQNLTHVITPVLHPILSEYQDESETIYYKYMQVVKILSLLGVFAGAFCWFASEEIIIIMFGKNWIESVGTFKILSISIWFQMILSSSGSIFQAANDTKGLFLSGAIGAIINITCIVIGVLYGKIEFVAYGVLVAYIFNFFVGFYLLNRRVFNKSIRQFLIHFKSSIIIIFIIIIGIVLIDVKIENIILSATFKLSITVVLYIFGLLITKEFKQIIALIVRR